MNAAVPVLRLYFDGGELKSVLRLSRRTVNALIAALASESQRGWSTDIEILVFLYWLAHATSYPVVSKAFDIPKSTVHDIVHRMCKAVVGLMPRVVTFPTDEGLQDVSDGFAQLAGSPAFRVAVGAIDGCHVRIKAPSVDAACYFNRKLFHSVQLQAICDHQGRFLDVFVGYPGSVHDARVLRNSPVYIGGLYPPAGFCILGDGGYPCTTEPIRIMTPYREPVQNPVQARYNSHHARGRVVIERAFGMLKARWRSIFFKALEVSPVFVPEVVACCAILHNLCMRHDDLVEEAVADDQPDDGPVEPERLQVRSGDTARDILAAAVSAPVCQVPALHEHDYM